MKRTLNKAVFLLAVAVLLFSALGCIDCGGVGFKRLSSYDEVQQRFNIDAPPGVVYPDLSALNFDPETVEYHIWPDDLTDKKSAVHEYDIYGKSIICGAVVSISFKCLKGLPDSTHIENPVMYKGTEIQVSSSEYPDCFYEGCYVVINGYDYRISICYDEGKLLKGAEFEELQTKIRDTAFSFICNIIDEATKE